MAKTSSAPNAVEAARGRVRELLDTEVAYAATRRRHAAELEEVRATNGARILAGELTAEEAGRRVAELTGAVEASGSAILAARAQRRQAIRALYEARADTIEAEVADLERKAEAIEAAIAEPLARLQELTGATYVPDHLVHRARPFIPDGFVVTVPWHEVHRQQAAELRSRAAAERDRRIVDAGSIEAPSVGELVRLVTADAEAMGPPLHLLEEWASKAVAEELAERARLARTRSEHADNWRPATGSEPVAIAVTWRNGELVERECRVTCRWERPEPDNEFDREQRRRARAADYGSSSRLAAGMRSR